MMKKRCVYNFVPEEHLVYDDSMVKYFGRHSSVGNLSEEKQYGLGIKYGV